MNLSPLRCLYRGRPRRQLHRRRDSASTSPQSTVTARIRTLEEQHRPGAVHALEGGAALTAPGDGCCAKAEAAVRAWEQGRQEARLPGHHPRQLSASPPIGRCGRACWSLDRLDAGDRTAGRRPAPRPRLFRSHLRQILHGLVDIGLMLPAAAVRDATCPRAVRGAAAPGGDEPRAIDGDWWDGLVYVDWGEASRADHAGDFSDLPTTPISAQTGDIAIKHIRVAGGRRRSLPSG